MPRHIPARAVTALGLTLICLAGCAGPAPVPTATSFAGGGAGTAEEGHDAGMASSAETGASVLDRAATDGMPELGIVPCDQLDEYEYSPPGGRYTWSFVFTCTSRDAYDATTTTLIGSGYESSPLVISEGSYVSERNYFLADANGGSTDVQLSIAGAPDELRYEVFVTLTLP